MSNVIKQLRSLCKTGCYLFLFLGFLSGCGGGGGTPSSIVPPPSSQPQQTGPDPLYGDQWHLYNSAQFAGLLVGEDIHVEPVWNDGIKGRGMLLVVVDDALEIGHEDLSANIAFRMSWDYRQRDFDPTPVSSDSSHGTQVAGIAAARDLNSVGGRGVAPGVSLAGYNLLWNGGINSAEIHDAMTRNVAEVAISNNSWGYGASGDGTTEHPGDNLWQEGVAYGVTYGRGGKGTIYVWAAGNGGEFGVDNSNYNYLTNNRHVIAVCAVDGDGVKTVYSEKGANLWLCAPGGYSNGLTTTDLMGTRGDNTAGVLHDYTNRNYTKLFAGTSAATPIVSGVVALMLEANPNLGWRDVRLILAESARKNDASDSDWRVTTPASGEPQYNINHKYGFGVVDAAAAVARAKRWGSNVGGQLQREFPVAVADSIPDGGTAGLQQTVTVAAANNLIIEYVEIDVNLVHGDPGELSIVLTAPSGTQSVLAEAHRCTTFTNTCPTTNYSPWTFGSSRHLGEAAQGSWRLNVVDQRANNMGSLISWNLRIYGRQR